MRFSYRTCPKKKQSREESRPPSRLLAWPQGSPLISADTLIPETQKSASPEMARYERAPSHPSPSEALWAGADTTPTHSAVAGAGAPKLRHHYTGCEITLPRPPQPAQRSRPLPEDAHRPLQDPVTTGLVPGTQADLQDLAPALLPGSVPVAGPVLHRLIIWRISLCKTTSHDHGHSSEN